MEAPSKLCQANLLSIRIRPRILTSALYTYMNHSLAFVNCFEERNHQYLNICMVMLQIFYIYPSIYNILYMYDNIWMIILQIFCIYPSKLNYILLIRSALQLVQGIHSPDISRLWFLLWTMLLVRCQYVPTSTLLVCSYQYVAWNVKVEDKL